MPAGIASLLSKFGKVEALEPAIATSLTVTRQYPRFDALASVQA